MGSAGNIKNENLKADLVVIGSGGGLVAALTAAEAGVANMILLEKQGVLGGNSRLANGFWACDSPPMKRANIVADKDEYFKTAMKSAHCARVNPRVVRAFIEKRGTQYAGWKKKEWNFPISR